MLKMSIEALQQNPGVDEYTWHCYVDGGGSVQNTFYDDDYPEIRFINRPKRVGVSGNILFAIKEMFEKYGYDHVLYVEDDIMVSQDFIRFAEYCLKYLKADDVFTIGAYGRRKPFTVRGDGYKKDEVLKLAWWHPWGLVLDKKDYEKLEPHINEKFLLNPAQYILATFSDYCKEHNPQYYEVALKDRVGCLWDGLCNHIRAYHNMYQLMPLWSRAQNIGYYGVNQAQHKWDGADLTDEAVQKRAMHNTEFFEKDYAWNELYLIPGKDYFLDDKEW